MHPYIQNGKHEREEMLASIGVSSVKELFADIPEDLQLKKWAGYAGWTFRA